MLVLLLLLLLVVVLVLLLVVEVVVVSIQMCELHLQVHACWCPWSNRLCVRTCTLQAHAN